MLKKELIKKRSGDENIGKLIVFAVTIIIAVGVLGTLAYFYNQSRESATKMSVLTSTQSSVSDLTGLKFCASDATTGTVDYDPISDKYTLSCSGADETEVKSVRGIVNAVGTTGSVTYKVNR